MILRREIVIRRFRSKMCNQCNLLRILETHNFWNYIKENISSRIVKSSIGIQPFEIASGKITALLIQFVFFKINLFLFLIFLSLYIVLMKARFKILIARVQWLENNFSFSFFQKIFRFIRQKYKCYTWEAHVFNPNEDFINKFNKI